MNSDPRETCFLDTAHIGRRILVFDSLPSTNDTAARLASDPNHHGTVVTAVHQTAGRGQYGRQWQSRPGASLLLSVALNPPAALRRPVVLIAWAAVAVAEAIRRLTGVPARIKWPNDLLIRGKKVCGILTESVVCGADVRSVVGIGLNVHQEASDFAAAGLPDATSLTLVTGQRFDSFDVLRSVVESLDVEYTRVVAGELVSLESDWKWRVGLLGQRVRVDMADGTTRFGQLRDMMFDGIEIEPDEGEIPVIPPEAIRQLKPTDPD